jgi:threonine dehydrogenase-like Zn-dependent dehydrogenase
MYAVRQSIPLRGAKVGIFGLGPIGLSVLVSANVQQPAAVYATDPLAYRRRVAETQGATWSADPAQPDLVPQIMAREADGLDVVFECCGKQEALDQAVQVLKPGGKLMVIGIPEFDRFSFAADGARRRELCLQHVRRQNHCVQPAIDAVAGGTIRPQFMVTHRFALAECGKAFDLVAGYADGVVKAMIEMHA